MANPNPKTEHLNHKLTKEDQIKGQKASTQAKKEKKLLKELLLERTNAKDLDEMLDNVIKRAKNTDKGFEVYRDTIGQKPTDKIKMDANVSYEQALKDVIGNNEY